MNEIIENNTTDVSATSFHADSLQVPQAVADQVQVKNRIQQLADNATDWHDTVYATSNEMLYGILKNCYAYYEAMCVNDGLAKQLRGELEQFCEKRLGKFSKDDHTLTAIVKCVFSYNANNRKRLSSYSIALRAAAEAKQTSSNIVQFIKDAGGVEELRLGQSKSGMTTDDKAENAKKAVMAQSLATIDSEAVAQQLDAAASGKLVVLVAEQLASGQLSVKALVDKEAVVKGVLASYYAIHRKDIDAQRSDQAVVDKTKAEDEAVQAAIDEAEMTLDA